MKEVISTIEQNCSLELEELFEEGKKNGIEAQLREVWRTDKIRKSKEFNKD
jgi:hypothetical protein